MDLITASINLDKIDQARVIKGQKGSYLDVLLVPTPNSERGDDWMVVQSVSKEERQAGQRGAILGNARLVKKKVDTGS